MGSTLLYVILVFCVWTYTNAFFASDVPKLVSSRYGKINDNNLKYGGGVKNVKGGRAGVKTKGKGDMFSKLSSAPTYEGGCVEQPVKPPNSRLKCSFYSGCSLTCERGYALPGRVYAIYIMCQNGKWIVQDTESEILPSCKPVCSPPCQNQGICTAPDQCRCPERFSGPQCQFENKPCLELPPMPQNSRRSCRSTHDYCTVSCLPGHQFPDGSEVATLSCKNGLWVPGREGWVSVPDCQATCSPPCQNGGVCLSLNVCQCPQDFRGPQCQYGVDACGSSKLNFNGGFNCSGDSERFVCSGLFCADGMELSHEPAPEYVCKYSEGVFHPENVPTCTSSISGGHLYKVSSSYSSKTKSKIVESSHEYGLNLVESDLDSVLIETKLPTPGVCYTWGGVHYKTFDGRLYSFDSGCAYTLVEDSVDNTFSISVESAKSCYNSSEECSRILNIYIQGRDYRLALSNQGNPILTQNGSILPIPGQAVGIRTEATPRYISVILDSVGVSLKWDSRNFIQVETKENLWNRTQGLCGNIDGDPDNDIVTKTGRTTRNVLTAVASWQVDDVDARCQSAPIEKRACRSDGIKGSISSQAHEFCSQLLSDRRFASCDGVLDKKQLLHSCTWDFCNCNSVDKADCACDSMNVYVSECKYRGLTTLTSWRDSDICPLKCGGGKVYKSCGPPKDQPVCGSSTTSLIVDPKNCEEGCFCPEGKVLHNDVCIPVSKCPCRLRKKEFPAGSSVPKDCNTCTCENGHWVCTQVSCGARCSAVGDPHYTTFDGRRYDFMGQCSYYLVQASDFSIETENVACPGAISELMSFTKSSASEMPSCTKTAIIRLNGSVTIKLKQNHDVLVNGQEITKLPLESAGLKIRSISSIFLQVELPNGVEVWWDGSSRIYVDIPASFKERTKGLCGTFNQNQKDDFLTPEGDIEQSVISFANKWKTKEACSNIPNKIPTHPCDVNMHRKSRAEELCSKIKSDIFGDCHFYVDPDQYYHNCLYDVCSCQGDLGKCLCTIVAAYAHECARKGVKVDWRNNVKECGIQCPAGQKYQVCGDSCARSCHDISTRPICKSQCVEGCNCPVGEALDEFGECIPVGQCKCSSNGIVVKPGYKEIRREEGPPDLCTCLNGGWSCLPATQEDLKIYPDTNDLKTMCNATLNLAFTSCEPAEPKTCKNMDSYVKSSPAICQPGCKCKKGYVLDVATKKCIKPSECPCHHGGRSYREEEIVQNDCNTCTCKGGKWSCTDRQCAAECSAWGDSHYKTFDGKHYDYQGQCDYVLAKGALGKKASFDISIQNVPCGTLGTTCSKSITIRVGAAETTESVTLSVGKILPVSSSLNYLTVREIGLYVIVEAPDLGLTVRWDRGTRVYVRLSPKWKNEVKGLCGNYNDNELDDFQTPSGGVTEVSPYVFGDSWKLEPYCPEAKQISDTCSRKPERRIWAMKKCGILKSSIFAPCHSEVPIDSFYDKCLFDTCGCDQGGDCECLCTALAAYAQECNNRGVPIHWRSQQLCPIQCDERCSVYNPCISTCLVETCDNIYTRGKISATCGEDTCVEGCQLKPCPIGQVYLNSSHDRCVPAIECKTVCLQIGGVTYYEGDVLEEDACHTCYCSRGEKTCKGKPCTQVPITSTTAVPEDQGKCISGWTEWINENVIAHNKGSTRIKEIENLPTSLIMHKLKGAKCAQDQITDIRCRTVGTKVSAKDTGLDAECSLERGLVCKPQGKGQRCPDFEIQVYCSCETPTEIPTTTTTVATCNPAERFKIIEDDCYGYYICNDGPEGPEYIRQTCGQSMMFNPETLGCDLIATVGIVRPECAIKTTTTTKQPTTSEYEIIITNQPSCNDYTLNKPHETDCHKFYVCEDTDKGPEYVEMTCWGTMIYNPKSYSCDRYEEVVSIRPECFVPTTPTTVETTVFVITGKPKCDDDTPKKIVEGDCHSYYVCNNGPDEAEYVLQTCGPTMMFNPETERCEPIDVVAIVRPECAVSTTTTTKKPTTTRRTTTTEATTTVVTITAEPKCNDDTPDKVHETNCHKFYTCEDGPDGPKYIEMTCWGTMMFNPKTLSCDRADIVSLIRPECAESTTTEATTTETTTGTSVIVITGHPKCDHYTLNRQHETDCHKFYVCEDTDEGPEYVEMTCWGTMIYNPRSYSCDRYEEVVSIRPECFVPVTTTPTTVETTVTSIIIITGKPKCDLETQKKIVEGDCHGYYVCNNGPDGAEYILQTCGPTMMFNPETRRCDPIDVVSIVRPECAISTTTTKKPTTTRTTTTKRTTIPETTSSIIIITNEPKCNDDTPNKIHETNCHKFYTCEDGTNGPEYVEMTCWGTMMFNPKTFSCDRADIVTLIRPECAESTTTEVPTTTTTERTTTEVIIITGKPVCDDQTPNKIHETDCHKYYICNDGSEGPEYVEVTCGKTMMYNPKTEKCDLIEIVSQIRPECEQTTTTTTTKKPTELPLTRTIIVTNRPSCDNYTLNRPHPSDCHKYYVCEDTDEGPKYVEMTCWGTMIFNPKSYSCDRYEEVIDIRPECFVAPTTPAETSTTSILIITGKPKCDIETQKRPHETDCHKYYVCENGPDGAEYIEQTCGGAMMFNTKTRECDRIGVVSIIRPECVKIVVPTTTESATEEIITAQPECNIETPNKPHQTDCHKFYVCRNTPKGPAYIEQTCGINSMFNIATLTCDTIDRVALYRPECVPTTTTTEATYTIHITGRPECDKLTLNRPHEKDCHKFYVCENGPDGAEYIEETCAGETLYNTKTFACDSVDVVRRLRPECDTRCPPGSRYTDCAIDCTHLCLFYGNTVRSQGICKEDGCVAGCVTEYVFEIIESGECDESKRWANNATCVKKEDCVCVSDDGKPVKPGSLYKESDCKVCQCINNYYVCDDSACTEKPTTVIQTTRRTWKPTEGTTKLIRTTHEQTTLTGKSVTPFIVVVNTATPPPPCTQTFIPLIATRELPDTIFNASSSRDPKSQPKEAKYSNKVGSWSPASSDNQPYLLIDLRKIEAVYGFKIKGNPRDDEYVTSYKVAYSNDGTIYHNLIDLSLAIQIIRGSIDRNTPAVQKLEIPFEARYVKIIPLTWHNDIALRVEVLSCGLGTTTPSSVTWEITASPTTTISPPICTDELGPSSRPLYEDQITVSTSRDRDHDKKAISLLEPFAWRPLIDSPTEWIQFDFLEPHNLTGFSTKGTDEGWVETFVVKYSHDGVTWNTILDQSSKDLVFPANYDGQTKITNYFPLPIQARYLRLYPTKWHQSIQVKAEIIGCYKLIATTTTTRKTTTTTTEAATTKKLTTTETITETCNYCPGVPSQLELGACECTGPSWWNGTTCVPRPYCPCVVGSLIYPIGKLFNKEDCSECICKIGGVTECSPKVCDKCPKGLKKVVTSACACTCEPCATYETLCSTTNICINTTLWCDGIVHCPDDEADCSYEITVNPRTPKPKPKVCPEVECPPGFEKVVVQPKLYGYSFARFRGSRVKGGRTKGGRFKGLSRVKGRTKGGVKGRRNELVQLATPQVQPNVCVQYKCVSNKPPPPFENTTRECLEDECPPGYDKLDDVMVDEESKICPALICTPRPVPDKVCKVTGRTFLTFDGTEYKYDICDHLIARDMIHKDWIIILTKNCTEKCSRDLHVYIVGDHFVFRPDLTVEYNDYVYTVEQLRKIGTQTKTFTFSKVGNVIAFTSLEHGFWIEWDTEGNVKVGLVASLVGQVDGLCGFFDNNNENDKRKPDGSIATTTDEFGDSWLVKNDTLDVCKINVCPIEVQTQAWQLCNTVRDSYLSTCSKAVNVNASVSRCLDTACECLQSSTKENVTNVAKCKCDLLQDFVVECLSNDQDVEVSGWRGQYDCPTDCPAPLIHKDCFRRECEPTCESLGDPKLCPKVDHACYPGCYCPEELVRKGDKCIKPSECRDCECKVTGQLDFLTYDETNFTMAGNCVYVLTRDSLTDKDSKRNFQVLIKNEQCQGNPNKTCVKEVTTLYKNHQITVSVDLDNSKFVVLIDSVNVEVDDYVSYSDWVKIAQNSDNELNILLISDQIEIILKYPSLGVIVRAPSYKYGGKLEGLCGDCNRDPDDDLRVPNGTITTDVEDFSLSWLFEDLPTKQTREQCKPKPIVVCKPLPENKNPCVHLTDKTIFGRCHPIVDYTIYQQWCDKETCTLEEQVDLVTVCPIIESYAKACAKEGICIDWHFDICPKQTCPGDKIFKPCGTTCEATCDTLNNKEISCVQEIVEGCFCPEGKVLKGDICIEERECIECDDEGHHPGDEWVKDICTNCTCDGSKLLCNKKECPAIETICEIGYKPIKVPTNIVECCDKYTCVPETTTTPAPTCPTPQPVTCGKDKVAKLHKKDDGCYQNICECIPKEECEPIDLTTATPLEDGYVQVLDESDCCAKLQLICKPELCPGTPKCPEFYEINVTKEENKCCPRYECVVPKEKCIFESAYIASENGGERPRGDAEKQKYLKNPLEVWNDGPCRTCECKVAPTGDYLPSCVEKQCPSIESSVDYTDYLIEAQLVYNQCCAKFTRKACKVNGTVYELDKTWIEDEDYCKIHKCSKNSDGIIVKEVQVTNCNTNCGLGYQYFPAKTEDEKCCGDCVQVACIINGTVKKVNEEWTSADYCVNSKCLDVNGTLQIERQETTCQTISPEIEKNYVVKKTKVVGECCDKYEVTACKVGDRIFEIEDTWTDSVNPCQNYKCSKIEDSKLAIVEYVTTCNSTCPLGYSYVPAESGSGKCCGTCQQAACIVEGQIRNVGEVWYSDDYCIKFGCVKINGMLQIEKAITTCREIPKSTLDNYVVKSEKVQGTCCEKLEITACKGDGKVYQPGETWTVGNDFCKVYKCVKLDQTLGISVATTRCNTTCPNGYRYALPALSEQTCCGQCEQTACIINGTVREVEEEWTSPDYCETFKCEKSNDALQISKTTIRCKLLPDETLKRFVVDQVPVDGECCSKNVLVACKDKYGLKRIVGDTWIEDKDFCRKYECVKNEEAGLAIKEYVTSCNSTCPIGFTYVPASPEDAKCCGTCEQTECIVDGATRAIDEKWESIDHCSKFKCTNSSGVIQVETQKTVCQLPSDDLTKDFVLQEVRIDGECCSKYKPIACKEGNETYQIGQIWPTSNPCRNITCIKDDKDQLIKRDLVENCKVQCEVGQEYKKSEDQCCGSCVQVACVVNGTVRQPGETWVSANGCANYTCERDEDRLVVTAQLEQCPALDCSPENVYDDGCCKRCNVTPYNLVLCALESISLEKTIGLVKSENIQHGVCVNKVPISNLTQCIGTCDSSTTFDSKLGQHTNLCTCCQALAYSKISVPMTCDDGFVWEKTLEVPSSCDCNGCQGGLPKMVQFSSLNTKSRTKTKGGRYNTKTKKQPMPIYDP